MLTLSSYFSHLPSPISRLPSYFLPLFFLPFPFVAFAFLLAATFLGFGLGFSSGAV